MIMERAGSGLSLSHPELAKGFPILLEIRAGVVVDFVVLQESFHLHSRFEAKEPPKLRGGKRVRPVCFEFQAFQRGERDPSTWIRVRGRCLPEVPT